METIRNEAGLKIKNRQRIAQNGVEMSPQIRTESFVFLESNFDESQETIELQYFTEYNYGGFRKMVFSDAAY